jgi:hypothetical protein
MALARWLETDSLSNQNISSALAIGAYTAAADRMIVCDVSLDQVAGGGDYVVYITRQINGAGSAYVMLPKTTCTAAAGETAIAMQSGPVTVRSGDVLTVYVDGLAGDTTTPDTVVRWFEMATLRPTTDDRTLDVSATGEAGLDFTNRLDTTGILPAIVAGGAGGLAIVGSAMTLAANSITAGVIATDAITSDEIAASAATEIAAAFSGAAGAGAITHTITINDGANPIEGASVWISTDTAGTNVIAGTLTTTSLGQVVFYLDAGTYYAWMQKSGFNFTNPTAITVA